MNMQQKFGERLLALLEEKNISQGEFAEKMNCSRQSINFYILGKRSPDISLAAQMAQYLGVSCDYLIGFSDFRSDREASFSVGSIGLTEDTMKFFAGLKLIATGAVRTDREKFDALGFNYEKEVLPYNMMHAQKTLDLLNALISHDSFGILLQYIKKNRDLCHGEDEMSILKDFRLRLESPETGKLYGGDEENMQMMQEFCLHVAAKYFEEIVMDIAK
jgi:transcriptional regulator with XRE-family HTH domain